MRISDDLITDPQMNPMAITLYLAMKLNADKKGYINKTATELGFYRSSIQKAVSILKNTGFISVLQRQGFKGRNIYRILK